MLVLEKGKTLGTFYSSQREFVYISKHSSAVCLLIVGQWHPYKNFMHLTPGDWRPVTGTQGGKRSGVWNYFKKNHELQMASCNECGTILSAKGGTTTALRNHLRVKHFIDLPSINIL